MVIKLLKSQSVAVCCSVLQYYDGIACPDHWYNFSKVSSIFIEHATHCNTLQHTATHCNTLQHTKVPQKSDPSSFIMQHIATHRNTLQHTATHCNTLQHAATHCNTLQHTTLFQQRALCSFNNFMSTCNSCTSAVASPSPST